VSAQQNIEQESEQLLLSTIIAVQKEQNRNLEKKIKKLTQTYLNDIHRLTQELAVAKKHRDDLERWVNSLSTQLDVSKVSLLHRNAVLVEHIKRKELEIQVLQADQHMLNERQPVHATDPSPKCCVCLDRIVSCVIIPCGHFVLCQVCVQKLATCPICKEVIQSKLRTYTC